MSYILDALRKAETERASHRASCLVSSRQRGFYPRRIQVRRFLYFGIILVCTMALTWWWARHDIPGGEQAVVPSAPEKKQVADVQVEPHNELEEEKSKSSHESSESSPKANFRVPMLRQPNTVEAVQTVVNTLGNTPIRRVADVSLREPRLPAAWPVKKQPIPGAAKDSSGTSASSSRPTSGSRNEVVAMIAKQAKQLRPVPVDDSVSHTPQSEIASNNVTAEKALLEEEKRPPLLSTLPYRFQSTLPEIVINAQAYAKEAQARFVIINMKKYREGERTEAGVVVEKISEEYLVLSYQGQIFRLQR